MMNLRLSCTALGAGTFSLLLLLLPRKHHAYPLRITSSPRQFRASHRQISRTAVSSAAIDSDGGDPQTPPAGNNLLEQLQRHTTIWADTAEWATVERLSYAAGVNDVTTNPSIVAATARRSTGAIFIEKSPFQKLEARAEAGAALALKCHELVAVDLGRRLLDVIPGRVCTQLDIRLTDVGDMVTKARDLVAMYGEVGVAKERVLIKTPATWAGIRATELLEREGIKCLVTLVCSGVQGRAAAEAGASIIATYVGRVSDWHKANASPASTAVVPASEDPGVTLTTDLKDYFVTHGLATEVMGASFRSVDQVAALAGCDHLTIAPGLINKMAHLPPKEFLGSTGKAGRHQSDLGDITPASSLAEKTFIESLGRDACGTSVLQSSVEVFTRDTIALEAEIAAHLENCRPRQ